MELAVGDVCDFEVDADVEVDEVEHGLDALPCSCWSEDVEGRVGVVAAEALDESWESEDVVAVPVGEADVCDVGQRDACDLHLALGAFSAVEEDAVAFEFEENSGEIAFFGGDHAACSEEGDVDHGCGGDFVEVARVVLPILFSTGLKRGGFEVVSGQRGVSRNGTNLRLPAD